MCAELLERLDLAFAAKREVKECSGGMRQRLGIAQALVVRLSGRSAADSVSLLEKLRPRGLAREAWRLAPWALVPVVAAAVRVGEG
ncbi:hypothetical protein OWM54_19265 [Myxococcus sp. MISCRS1]|uniref:hypothetical protein n=1 Tax=Myxococcus sp. MISCRS1 TaxID=2996786 RepID=UPI00226F6291|nr:hypothetical protein [Myxococcus sp. MISCRS1]MCY0999279.1 hypothetical protein [Myxococcus sp. MISCRS1]